MPSKPALARDTWDKATKQQDIKNDRIMIFLQESKLLRALIACLFSLGKKRRTTTPFLKKRQYLYKKLSLCRFAQFDDSDFALFDFVDMNKKIGNLNLIKFCFFLGSLTSDVDKHIFDVYYMP